MKTTNIIEKNLDTKQKKIAAGCIAGGILVIGVAGAVILNNNGSKDLIFTSNEVYAEFGQKVSTNVADYLDANKVDNLDKIIKDTTKPEIEAPETIDIIQYTDLSTFNFGELLKATDYSDVNEWEFDTSDIDMNTIGTYDMKVSISDKYKNKSTKKVKVNVVEAPAIAEGEIAVTEIVTDENGNKKTVVTKKSSSSVESNDTVTTGKPVTNTNKVEKPSTDSSTKPSSNSGTSKPSGSNSRSSSSGSSSSSNTGSSSSSSTKGDEHKHNYNIPITKTVHHNAVTRNETYTVVDKEAWDEPVYETHVVCKVCGEDFGKNGGADADDHSIDTGHSYTSKKVQVGTKHHDAITHQETRTVTVTPAYDETVTTGYKCSCDATK